jgi:hypothetical protein
LASQKADLAWTWVLIDDDRVIGAFSLVLGHVRPEDAPQELVRYPVSLGADLLAHARLVAVDAIDEQAAVLYRRWGFVPGPEQPLTLYRRIKDIRRTLNRA